LILIGAEGKKKKEFLSIQWKEGRAFIRKKPEKDHDARKQKERRGGSLPLISRSARIASESGGEGNHSKKAPRKRGRRRKALLLCLSWKTSVSLGKGKKRF